jgi:hypothetical protein
MEGTVPGLAGRGDMETMLKPPMRVCPHVGGNAADVSAIQMLCILIYLSVWAGTGLYSDRFSGEA